MAVRPMCTVLQAFCGGQLILLGTLIGQALRLLPHSVKPAYVLLVSCERAFCSGTAAWESEVPLTSCRRQLWVAYEAALQSRWRVALRTHWP